MSVLWKAEWENYRHTDGEHPISIERVTMDDGKIIFQVCWKTCLKSNEFLRTQEFLDLPSALTRRDNWYLEQKMFGDPTPEGKV